MAGHISTRMGTKLVSAACKLMK